MSTTRRLATLGCLAALTACTYAPAEDLTRVEQVLPLGDSFRALVVVRHDRYRRPTGLGAFPDGGRWRFERREAREYLIDAQARTAVELARQEAADSLWESFGAHIRALVGDSVAYVALTGCPRGGECHPGLARTELLRLSVTGEIRPVSDVPASAGLPGTMLARRPGEERYVRYGRDGDVITARFDEGGAYTPLFRVGARGELTPILSSGQEGTR